MADTNQITQSNASQASGPYLARVVSNIDPTYMGTLEVEILRPQGGSSSEGQLHQVKYMSPFLGATSVDHVSENNDYDGTQKSYGMWMIPPDPGVTVVVFFIDGDAKRGFWMGCIADENMNFMIPGIPATSQVVDETKRSPTAEYNKKANESVPDPEQVKKPAHPLKTVLETQGLLEDDIRGLTTSSARREAPSMVFGISTPGPIDKRPGAQRGTIGKKEYKVDNAFVSRLGGTTLVMDDGDDKFLRKKLASAGAPEYAAVEQGETGGLPDVPHNELFRIRTRTGHQILLHNSEDLIYVGNAKGTTWIEMTSNGKIDIFAEDSISIHTKNDLNVVADRDINLSAVRDLNLNAGRNTNITSVTASNINSGQKHVETAGRIDMNGPVAPKAPKPVRIPQHEPWVGHENLDPTAVLPAKTEAKLAVPAPATPAAFKKYTTVTDTFAKVRE